MKLGILTFHRSINYGSVLQAYALTKFLLNHDIDVEIIDYVADGSEELYNLYQKTTNIKAVIKNITSFFLFSSYYAKREKKFHEFLETRIPISKKKYNSKSDFSVLQTFYDGIICGSDQIWNVGIQDCDKNFFLPMSFNGKRYSYAVSINRANLNDSKFGNDSLKEWLNRFSNISMRERSGCKRIDAFLCKQIAHYDVDPTLLLESKDYDQIIGKKSNIKDYIFMYSVTYSKDTINAARKLSDTLGLPIYSMITQRNSLRYTLPNSDIKILKNKQGIEDFIQYIKNATLVVTDSFHGTAFSLIYNKQFFVVNRRDLEGKYYNDERLENILKDLELMDHYVTANSLDRIGINQSIDYSRINPKLDELRSNSSNYLLNVLEDYL